MVWQTIGWIDAAIDTISDEELLADADLELIYSTTETAEFFDRSNQWLYWGMREGIFVYPDGTPITPERVGDDENGRRRFTLPIIRAILKASYRRGNVEPEELKHILRRIRIAELGGERLDEAEAAFAAFVVDAVATEAAETAEVGPTR